MIRHISMLILYNILNVLIYIYIVDIIFNIMFTYILMSTMLAHSYLECFMSRSTLNMVSLFFSQFSLHSSHELGGIIIPRCTE